MLIQKFIAMCDEPCCLKKVKAKVSIKLAPTEKSLSHNVCFQPIDIEFEDDPNLRNKWTWGWDAKVGEVVIYCPKHSSKNKRR